MKYQYIPTPKKNKIKKLATALFFAGLVLFVLGGVKMIPFRVVLQTASVAAFTSAILLVGRFLLRAYGYRIEDLGEGDEFLVDEITRSTCVNVCRLELSKLVGVKEWDKLTKEEKGIKYYNYSPDPWGDGTYLLEFYESEFDNTDEKIRVRVMPDEKLLALLKEYEKNEEE